MQITDILAQMGGLQSMARELGVSVDEAAAGAAALTPAILGGFKRQAQSRPAGLEELGGLLGQLGGGGLLDNVLGSEPTDVNRGNDVLGEIFGSKDVSRTVAQNAASQTGLPAGLLKKMLPILAMLLAGYMAKRSGDTELPGGMPGAQDGGDLGGLGGLGGQAGGGLGGLLGGLLGGQAAGAGNAGSGLGSMLDMNGDGNALDDILRMAGKVMR